MTKPSRGEVVEVEDVHVADEYVVDVSPESVEDADIELTVRDRRVRHEAIRRAHQAPPNGSDGGHSFSTARMWEEHASGEDLVALQTPGGSPGRTSGTRSCLRCDLCSHQRGLHSPEIGPLVDLNRWDLPNPNNHRFQFLSAPTAKNCHPCLRDVQPSRCPH